MANLMQKKSFIRGGESSTFSVDAIDLITGIGYNAFYFGDTYNGVYSISNFTYDSHQGAWSYSATGSGADWDFDTTVVKPFTLYGDAIAHIYGFLLSGKVGSWDIDVTVKLRKVSGGVETEIASATANCSCTGGTANFSRLWSVKMAVPVTHYGNGDKLRVTIVAEASGDGSRNVILFFNPVNKSIMGGTEYNSATYPNYSASNSQIKLPFRLDL